MKEPELGIVLRSFLPAKQKVSVLFSRSGKQTVVIIPIEVCRKLSIGMTILCCHSSRGSSPLRFVDYCDIKNVYMGTKNNLLGIHRLCEICYYFLPENVTDSEVMKFFSWYFEFLQQELMEGVGFSAVQRLCEFKLFCLLSFYPPEDLVGFVQVFHRLVSVFVDSKNNGRVISKEVVEMLLKDVVDRTDEIGLWLEECAATHQCYKKFKTIGVGL